MTEFGMPTLIETESIDECAHLCSDLGFQFIEINMNMPEYQSDSMDLSHFKEIAKKFGIYFTIHLDENLNIGDFNPYVADAYIKTVTQTIEIAKAIDAPIINMHLTNGVYFTLPNERIYLFNRYINQYLAKFSDFIKLCETAIGDSGIKICIENCDGFKDFHIQAIELMLKSPVFSLTYDVGHDHCINGKDGEFIIKNSDKLLHMHLHDAIGIKHHLALGSGEININNYLKIAENNKCRVVIETKTIESLKQSVRWLQNQ